MRVNFPSIYFLHFVARSARTPNLFCVNILKDKPSQRKKHSATCEQKQVFLFTGFSVKEIPKTVEKSECWVVSWSQKNKGFTDKKRGGRGKAMYKTGNPTR